MICLEFGWFLNGLWVVWLVCGWLGCFVDSLDDLWVVSSFTANFKKERDNYPINP